MAKKHTGRVTSVRDLEDGKHVEVEMRHGRRQKKGKDGMDVGYDRRPTTRAVFPKGHPDLSGLAIGSHVSLGIQKAEHTPGENLKTGKRVAPKRAKRHGKKGGGKGPKDHSAGNKRSPSPIATAMGYKQGPESYSPGDDDGGE